MISHVMLLMVAGKEATSCERFIFDAGDARSVGFIFDADDRQLNGILRESLVGLY